MFIPVDLDTEALAIKTHKGWFSSFKIENTCMTGFIFLCIVYPFTAIASKQGHKDILKQS